MRPTCLVLLLCALVLLIPACAGKSAGKKNRPANPLPALEIRWIKGLNPSRLTPADRQRLQGLTWKACPHWRGTKQSVQRVLGRKTPDLEDRVLLLALLESMCREVRSQVIDRGIRVEGSRAWYDAVWRVCRFASLGVVTEKEAARRRGLAINISVLYKILVQCGQPEDVARILGRAWLRPHPLLQGPLQGVTLPRGDVLRSLSRAPMITLTASGKFLNGRKATGDLGKGLKGSRTVALLADKQAKFQAVAKVVRALAGAGVRDLHLVVRGRDDEPAVIPVDLRPKAEPGKGIPPLGLTLTVTASGLELSSRFGPECLSDTPEEEHLCFKRQGDALPLEKLRHHLWWLFAAKYRDPSSYADKEERHTLQMAFAAGVSWAEVIQVIRAVREIPRSAKRPPAPKPFPPGGCARSFDKRSGTWRYYESQGVSIREKACMYDHVRLIFRGSSDEPAMR